MSPRDDDRVTAGLPRGLGMFDITWVGVPLDLRIWPVTVLVAPLVWGS